MACSLWRMASSTQCHLDPDSPKFLLYHIIVFMVAISVIDELGFVHPLPI